MIKGQEQEWQRDPETLRTDKIQLYSASGIFLRLISLVQAREMITDGIAFAICEQAISKFK